MEWLAVIEFHNSLWMSNVIHGHVEAKLINDHLLHCSGVESYSSSRLCKHLLLQLEAYLLQFLDGLVRCEKGELYL